MKSVGAKWAWSDRWRAVADLRVEFVGHLVRPRLLQHVVLHDGLLVSVDGRVRVVGVVPRLVPAGLIGRLRGHGLFALTAQQVAADTNQEVVVTPSRHATRLPCDAYTYLKLGVADRCWLKPFSSSGEKHIPMTV